MNLRILNRICFTICIVCIVAGTVLSLAMIWGEFQDRDLIIKGWLTLAVFFLASLLTMGVSKTLVGVQRTDSRREE